MTTLGLFFLAAYIVGFAFRRRLGILTVAAAAIPFNDSAALILNGIPISPFYFGMLAFLPLTYLSTGLPRTDTNLPLLLGIWAWLITLLGPGLFSHIPVVASGVGLDEQVGRLSQLDYTSSNIAQIVYLTLNLLLLMAIAMSMDAKRWIPLVPAIFGTAVALLAWSFDRAGIAWPDNLFQNNTRNAYAYVETPRFAAYFSEPSHLGAFALTSAVLVTATAINSQQRAANRTILLLTAAADILLIVESTSAAALAGAGIFGVVALFWTLYRLLTSGARVSVGAALASLTALAALVLIAPRISDLVRNIIEYKLSRGTSIRGRSAADSNSWQIFLDTGTFGVGLGSNRSSSLLLLLLSTVGLIGTTLFLLIMARSIRNGIQDSKKRPLAAALAALLIVELVAFADLVSPMMWLLAGFCWNSSPKRHAGATAGNETSDGLSDPGPRERRTYRA